MYLILFTGDEAVPEKDVWCWCREEEHGNMLITKLLLTLNIIFSIYIYIYIFIF